MKTLGRKSALLAALSCLSALAVVPAAASADPLNDNAVVCYVKTHDTIKCFHAGP